MSKPRHRKYFDPEIKAAITIEIKNLKQAIRLKAADEARAIAIKMAHMVFNGRPSLRDFKATGITSWDGPYTVSLSGEYSCGDAADYVQDVPFSKLGYTPFSTLGEVFA